MAIGTLKEDTEIIFISGMNLHKTPEVVPEAFAMKKALAPTPITTVLDAEVENLLEIVPYFPRKDVHGFTNVLDGLAKYRRKTSPSSLMTRYEVESWRDQRGRSLEAAHGAAATS